MISLKIVKFCALLCFCGVFVTHLLFFQELIKKYDLRKIINNCTYRLQNTNSNKTMRTKINYQNYFIPNNIPFGQVNQDWGCS